MVDAAFGSWLEQAACAPQLTPEHKRTAANRGRKGAVSTPKHPRLRYAPSVTRECDQHMRQRGLSVTPNTTRAPQHSPRICIDESALMRFNIIAAESTLACIAGWHHMAAAPNLMLFSVPQFGSGRRHRSCCPAGATGRAANWCSCSCVHANWVRKGAAQKSRLVTHCVELGGTRGVAGSIMSGCIPHKWANQAVEQFPKHINT